MALCLRSLIESCPTKNQQKMSSFTKEGPAPYCGNILSASSQQDGVADHGTYEDGAFETVSSSVEFSCRCLGME